MLLFAATVGPRPAGLEWNRLFDVVFYNAGPSDHRRALLARGRTRQAEGTAWRALTASLLLSAADRDHRAAAVVESSATRLTRSRRSA